MSIGTGFAMLSTAAAFTRWAGVDRRNGKLDAAERCKRIARDHLQLAQCQPPPNLPDRKVDHDQG